MRLQNHDDEVIKAWKLICDVSRNGRLCCWTSVCFDLSLMQILNIFTKDWE